jgi:hypothetical protein
MWRPTPDFGGELEVLVTPVDEDLTRPLKSFA